MTETRRILDQLHRAYTGPAWHGPALQEILAGVTAEMAARRPLPGAHSIHEIVLHIAVWENVAARRAEGESLASLPPEQDWPPVRDSSEAGWRKTLDTLDQAQRQLESMIANLPDSRLSETVQGDVPHSLYTLLHGVVQHNLYHAGQIALLKKA